MATVALPFLVLELLSDDVILLSSPTRTLLASIGTGDVLFTQVHTHASQSPRCSAVLPLPTVGTSTGGAGPADCLVALLGDDKELQVFHVAGLGSNAAVRVEKTWSTSLPKRGVKMLWEDGGRELERRLVVGDRHGDIRSFVIPLDSTEANERETKRRRTTDQGDAEDQDGEDFDSTHPPHVGHVAMLTDFVLTSFTSPGPLTPASFIISSDRDEHIRISRWGSRRAGHLALRYLLGSTAAVGGMCVIEHGLLDVLCGALKMEGAEGKCRSPLLLSTESSRLRLWSLHNDDQVGSNPDCLLVIDLFDAIAPYLRVDPKREQRREKTFGKGKVDSKKNEERASNVEEEPATTVDAEMARGSIVMLRLSAMAVDGDVHVSFVVDGASALFTVSLSKLLTSPAARHVQAMDVGLPLLDHTFQVNGEERLAWIACDVRPGIIKEGRERRGLRVAQWSSKHRGWEERTAPCALIDKQDQLQSKGSPELAHSLLLYDALTLYPKLEFEVAPDLERTAPNGLVRGGMAGLERTGKPKGMPNGGNKSNSERATGKKEKARADMLRRIGEALGGEEPSPQ